jgi:hypothetical protein
VYTSGIPSESSRTCEAASGGGQVEQLCQKYSQATNSIYIPQRSQRRKADNAEIENYLTSFFPDLKDYQTVEKLIINIISQEKLDTATSADDIRIMFDRNKKEYANYINTLDLFADYATLIKQEKDTQKLRDKKIMFVKKIIAAVLGSVKFTLFDHLEEFKDQATKVTASKETGKVFGEWYKKKFAEKITVVNTDSEKYKWVRVAQRALSSLRDYEANLNTVLKNMLLKKKPQEQKDVSNIKNFMFYEFDLIHENFRKTISGEENFNPSEYTDLIKRVNVNYDKQTKDTMIYVVERVRDFFNNNLILKNILRFQLEKVESDSMNVFDAVFSAFDTFQDTNNIMNRVGNFKTTLSYIYDQTADIYVELYCRGKASEKVCKIRRNEGYMINRTLEEVRGVIRKVIADKNRNSISIVPPFVDQCLPYYCLNGSCFTNSTSTSDKSVIFDTLKKELGGSMDKLVMSVFCVYNISYRANNPPPVPYIDINMMKTFLTQYRTKGITKYRDLLVKEARYIIRKIEIDLESKTGDIRNLDKYTEFKESVKWTDEMLINESFLTLINQDDKFIKLLENITDIKESIDAFNAASALGTLEFVDSLAKYYSTDIVCQPNKLNSQYSKDVVSYMFEDVLNVKPAITTKVSRGGAVKRNAKKR